jgi:hypothetical protein
MQHGVQHNFASTVLMQAAWLVCCGAAACLCPLPARWALSSDLLIKLLMHLQTAAVPSVDTWWHVESNCSVMS